MSLSLGSLCSGRWKTLWAKRDEPRVLKWCISESSILHVTAMLSSTLTLESDILSAKIEDESL